MTQNNATALPTAEEVKEMAEDLRMVAMLAASPAGEGKLTRAADTLEDLHARLARAAALADEWESTAAEGICYAAGELRAALGVE